MDDSLKNKARAARIKVLEMVHRAQTSHIASNFSVIDIATTVYSRLKPEDKVVWSKGWAAASVYYFLAMRGEIPLDHLDRFPNEPYIGLAETTVNGVLCNGGAVGHGTPIAVGLALGLKKSKKPGIVYCIMSDGELNEGTVWESVMVAAHHKLDNLVFLVDMNGWQAMGRTKDVMNFNAKKAFNGFEWQVREIDGHNYNSLSKTINHSIGSQGAPKVVLCNTIKGKGVSLFEDKILYHYKNIDDETYELALDELYGRRT